MKFLPLIWAGIWRKRGRAILMLLQIVSTFALFGVLQGLNTGIKEAIARTHADRLYVASRVSLSDPLPLAHLSRLQAVPGVKARLVPDRLRRHVPAADAVRARLRHGRDGLLCDVRRDRRAAARRSKRSRARERARSSAR